MLLYELGSRALDHHPVQTRIVWVVDRDHLQRSTRYVWSRPIHLIYQQDGYLKPMQPLLRLVD